MHNIFADAELRSFGLVWSGWRIYYGLEHGWFQLWPDWLQDILVRVWNFFACKVLGHEYLSECFTETRRLDEEIEDVFDPYCLHCGRLDPDYVKVGGTD